jgi:hypothetical protein
VLRRGGDPNIGPKLPSLLIDAGFADVGVAIVQPVGLTGEAKLLNPITMDSIASWRNSSRSRRTRERSRAFHASSRHGDAGRRHSVKRADTSTKCLDTLRHVSY